MSNQIEGNITKVLPLQEGVSQTGKAWKRAEFILTTAEQYPRTICFSVLGEKVDQYAELIKENNQVSVAFDIESREVKGRWYTSCKAYKIDKIGEAQPTQQMNYDAQAQAFFNAQPAPAPQQPQYPTNQPQRGNGFQGNPSVPQNGYPMQGGYQQSVAPAPTDSLPF